MPAIYILEKVLLKCTPPDLFFPAPLSNAPKLAKQTLDIKMVTFGALKNFI